MISYFVSHPAAADLSASAGRVARYTTGVAIATDPAIGTQDVIGIIAQGGGNTQGEPVVVCSFGEVLAVAGAVLTPGTHRFLSFDNQGRVIPASAGEIIVAEWVGQGAGAAAAGNLVTVFVNKSLYIEDTDT